jgi:hypothetical protein
MGKFEFWFELWKQSYFSLFFPNISLELGITESIEGSRYLPLVCRVCAVYPLRFYPLSLTQ